MIDPGVILSTLAYAEAYKKEAIRFDIYCKSLPPEQAEKLQAERKKQREEELQHQRNLEVAREGRSKNFWGDR